MIRLILAVCDCFAWALRVLHVDYPQFRAILQTKLTLDARRPRGAFGHSTPKKQKNIFAITLVSYVVVGLFVSPLVAAAKSPLVSLTIIHAVVMVMVALSLLGDYATVLLDTTDNRVLLPRPVSNRTILFARLAHILIYLLVITLSLTCATFIVGSIFLGRVFPLVFGITLVLSVGLIVATVSLTYLLGMRYVPQEKLRDAITYVQIVMTVIFVGGYQIVPRLIAPALKANFNPASEKWIYFCPPAWMAGPVELALGRAGVPEAILTVQAMLAPVLMLLLVAWLAPTFQPAAMEGEEHLSTSGPQRVVHRRRLLPWLARLLVRRPAERGAFELAWRLSSRDRQYKLRVYPTIAFTVVVAFGWLLLDADEGWRSALAELPHSDKHLFLLYFASMLVPVSLIHLRFSNQPEAAWIYFAVPLERPGEVLLGALKAVVVRLMLPTFVLVSAVALGVWGTRILPDVVLALTFTLLSCVLEALLIARALPFSEAPSAMEDAGRSLRGLLLLLIVGAFGATHYLIRGLPLVVLAASPFVLLLAFALTAAYRRTSWTALRRSA